MHDASFPPIKSSCGLGREGGVIAARIGAEVTCRNHKGLKIDISSHVTCLLYLQVNYQRFYLNRAQTLDSARNSLQRIICPLCLKAQLVQDLLKAGSDSTVQMFKHMHRVLVTSLPETVWHNPAKTRKRLKRLTLSALTAAHFPLKLRFKDLRFAPSISWPSVTPGHMMITGKVAGK